jgi:hypothetical protein
MNRREISDALTLDNNAVVTLRRLIEPNETRYLLALRAGSDSLSVYIRRDELLDLLTAIMELTK